MESYETYRDAFIATGDISDLLDMERFVTADCPKPEFNADSLGFKILCDGLAILMTMGILAFLVALVIGG